jgi:hypothetical protein
MFHFQDAVIFFQNFFGGAEDPEAPSVSTSATSLPSSANSNTVSASSPVTNGQPVAQSPPVAKMPPPSTVETQQATDPYFQAFSISEIVIVVDYKPKHLDVTRLREGDLSQAVNFMAIEGVEIALKPVQLRGVSGMTSLVNSMLEVWMPEIVKTQIWKYFGGMTPIKSIVRCVAKWSLF